MLSRLHNRLGAPELLEPFPSVASVGESGGFYALEVRVKEIDNLNVVTLKLVFSARLRTACYLIVSLM